MNNRNLHFLVIILVLLVITTGPYLLKQIYNNSQNKITQFAKIKKNSDVKKVNPFLNLKLGAKSAYVLDVDTNKKIYGYKENEILPLASLTKLMTAVVATDMVPQSTVVIVDKNDIKEEGDSGLFVNEKWRLSDLIDFTLTSSSNDGASAIASVAGSFGQNAYGMPQKEAKKVFIKKMNEKSKELGLISTRFLNESGLDISNNISGAYGTTRDIAYLMKYAIKNKLSVISATSIKDITRTSLSKIRHNAKNTNEYVGDIPGLIASKTGYTDLAGGNLVVAIDAGMSHPIIISVLGSTISGRFKDVEKLAWATLQYLKQQDK